MKEVAQELITLVLLIKRLGEQLDQVFSSAINYLFRLA